MSNLDSIRYFTRRPLDGVYSGAEWAAEFTPAAHPAPLGEFVPVFRVEHRGCGCGPSNSRNTHGPHITPRLLEDPWGDPRHPAPHEDGISEDAHRGEFYGFASVADLTAWFGEYAEFLRADDFVVVVYRVDSASVTLGGHQCVFDRAYAEPVTEFEPDVLERPELVTQVTV